MPRFLAIISVYWPGSPRAVSDIVGLWECLCIGIRVTIHVFTFACMCLWISIKLAWFSSQLVHLHVHNFIPLVLFWAYKCTCAVSWDKIAEITVMLIFKMVKKGGVYVCIGPFYPEWPPSPLRLLRFMFWASYLLTQIPKTLSELCHWFIYTHWPEWLW